MEPESFKNNGTSDTDGYMYKKDNGAQKAVLTHIFKGHLEIRRYYVLP